MFPKGTLYFRGTPWAAPLFSHLTTLTSGGGGLDRFYPSVGLFEFYGSHVAAFLEFDLASWVTAFMNFIPVRLGRVLTPFRDLNFYLSEFCGGLVAPLFELYLVFTDGLYVICQTSW